MRIAITGGEGVLGQSLRPWLEARGDKVVSIDLHPASASVRGDVRDTDRLAALFFGCDAVVHSAATLPSSRPEQIRSVDVDGTSSTLQAACRANVPRFVHISSTAVYGLPKLVPTPEDHRTSGVDPYSRAKIAAEALCESYRSRFEALTVLRPKTFLGPGRLGLFAMLFEWAAEGRDFPVLGSGEQRTQMLHVDDLCSVVGTVLTKPAGELGGPYNLGATEFGTIAEDFQAVLDAAGHGGQVRRLQVRPAVVALAVASRLGSSPVYPRLIHKLRGHSYVDVSRAERDLGFAPSYSNERLLVETFRWWSQADHVRQARPGTTHTQPWRQGLLALAKPLFA